jgi:hypothetical protein
MPHSVYTEQGDEFGFGTPECANLARILQHYCITLPADRGLWRASSEEIFDAIQRIDTMFVEQDREEALLRDRIKALEAAMQQVCRETGINTDFR